MAGRWRTGSSASWSNGELGTFGPSYLSFVQWALASSRPPQLKAMAIHVMSADRTPTYYPGGTFALDNALTWTFGMAHMERGLHRLLPRARQRRRLGRVFMQLPLRSLDVAAVGHAVPYYRAWLDHAPGDEFWRRLDYTRVLADHLVPTSFVGGWYDYFLPAMLEDHARLFESGAPTQLVVGAWRHSSAGGALASLREALAWFEVHLRGGPAAVASPVRYEVMGGGGWRRANAWPPPTGHRSWYLQPGGRLRQEIAPASEPDRHRYDPGDPTPAIGGTSLSANSGPWDNRPLEAREDVLTYSTTPLGEDLEIAGPVLAELFIQSSVAHFDVFARLCDVDARGRSVNVCDGILRCQAGTSLPVRVELWPTAHRFASGHRIRLQVSGGSHPRFARNLGCGEPIGTGTRLVIGDRALFHDPDRPSRVVLPVSHI